MVENTTCEYLCNFCCDIYGKLFRGDSGMPSTVVVVCRCDRCQRKVIVNYGPWVWAKVVEEPLQKPGNQILCLVRLWRGSVNYFANRNYTNSFLTSQINDAHLLLYLYNLFMHPTYWYQANKSSTNNQNPSFQYLELWREYLISVLCRKFFDTSLYIKSGTFTLHKLPDKIEIFACTIESV